MCLTRIANSVVSKYNLFTCNYLMLQLGGGHIGTSSYVIQIFKGTSYIMQINCRKIFKHKLKSLKVFISLYLIFCFSVQALCPTLCICVEDDGLKIEFVMGEICCGSMGKERPENDCEKSDFVKIKAEEPFVTTNYNGLENGQLAAHNHLSLLYDTLYCFVDVVTSPEGLAPPPFRTPPNKSQIYSKQTVVL